MFIQNSLALNESQTSCRKDGLWFCRNGTVKRQTDYLFICWFGGCFCPSWRTSIPNVKGPHLGCVKMHHVETETKLSAPSQTKTAVSEAPTLALAFGLTLCNHFMNMDQGKRVSLSCHPPGIVGRRESAEHVQVSGGGRSCVMADEWKPGKRKR